MRTGCLSLLMRIGAVAVAAVLAALSMVLIFSFGLSALGLATRPVVAALTGGLHSVKYQFGESPKIAYIPASTQIRAAEDGDLMVLLCVRCVWKWESSAGFSALCRFTESKEELDGHHCDDSGAADRAAR